jgi:acyl carrier protein
MNAQVGEPTMDELSHSLIKDKIFDFLAAEVTFQLPLEMKRDTWSLVDEVDSLGIQALVTFLESEFGFLVSATDVTLEKFKSVDAVAEFVRASRTAASGATSG